MHILEAYRRTHGMTYADLAALFGLKRSSAKTAERWCKGTVPRRQMMRRICAVTNGAITANDFFNPPPPNSGGPP